MTQTVLILGASGRFGRHVRAEFSFRGWDVRTFDRAQDDLWDKAWGAQVIVNAWNPVPWTWDKTLPNLTRQVIDVAKASGATVVIPGNVYGFGAGMPEVLDEDTPHRPTRSYGQLRVEMEEAYRAAGVHTVILRAGDFIDTEASGNWFDQIIMAKVARGKITAPGPVDVPHAWAYLPDMATALVELMDRRDTLEVFEDIPFPGHTLTFEDLHASAERVAGRRMQLSQMSWLPLRVMRLFSPMMRYLTDMRYLWQTPHTLDGTKLARLLPDFAPTPLDQLMAEALGDQIHPDEPVRARRKPIIAQEV